MMNSHVESEWQMQAYAGWFCKHQIQDSDTGEVQVVGNPQMAKVSGRNCKASQPHDSGNGQLLPETAGRTDSLCLEPAQCQATQMGEMGKGLI